MTGPQENKNSMYRVAEKLLDDNSIIWNGTPAFVTTKGAFSAKITAISTASQQQQAIITGIATDKKVLKTSLIDITAPVAAAVIAYASQTNNNELLDAVNFTRSQLLATRDDMLADRCQIIHTKATANLVALAPYGITAPVLTTLQTTITAYNAKVPAPGTAKQSKKTATINLRNLFKETDTILKLQLDKLMLVYKTTNSDFYNNYLGAREIIDLGSIHTKLKMQVKGENGLGIQNATASLIQNNLVIYSIESDAEGKILLKKIKPGTYNLKVQKPGFDATYEAAVKFKAGKQIARTIVLVPGNSNPANGTAVIEGTLGISPAFANATPTNINGTPLTHVTIVTTAEPIRIFASATLSGIPGPVFFDVLPGAPVTKLGTQFAQELGFDDSKPFLIVLNMGPNPTNYKFTFDNLENP